MLYNLAFSFLRQGLLAGGGYLVGRGVMEASTMVTAVGAVMAGVSAAWATWNNTPTQIVAKAEGLDSVDRIRTTDQSIADALGPKVTGPVG